MAIEHTIQVIDRNNASYPYLLAERLGKDAPVRLRKIGLLKLIDISKTEFFCSNRCPGNAVLETLDQA